MTTSLSFENRPPRPVTNVRRWSFDAPQEMGVARAHSPNRAGAVDERLAVARLERDQIPAADPVEIGEGSAPGAVVAHDEAVALLPRLRRAGPVTGRAAEQRRGVSLHHDDVDPEPWHLQDTERLTGRDARSRCFEIRGEVMLARAVPDRARVGPRRHATTSTTASTVSTTSARFRFHARGGRRGFDRGLSLGRLRLDQLSLFLDTGLRVGQRHGLPRARRRRTGRRSRRYPPAPTSSTTKRLSPLPVSGSGRGSFDAASATVAPFLRTSAVTPPLAPASAVASVVDPALEPDPP